MAIGATAQSMMTPTASSSRQALSLDGDWNAIIDPYGHGDWNYWQDAKFDGTVLQDYDFDTSPTLRVPGDWNTQRPEFYYYEGRMWYRRKFKTPDFGGRIFLHFDAANYKAKVWLNGREVGQHEGGYTSFEFEVTSLLSDKGADNSLVVMVNNQRLPDGVPTLNTDWWNYGGITRSVRLLSVPDTHIRDFSLQLSDPDPMAPRPKTTRIVGWVNLAGPNAAAQQVKVEIPDLKLSATATTDAQGRAEVAFTLPKSKLRLWSPADPHLYNVVISTATDNISDLLGFRTVRADKDKILLNGKPVFLAGINIHEETIGDSRRATTRSQDSLLLAEAKALGCNFVRLAHYPHNEQMTRLADQMGLLVWSEIPLYWGIDWSSQRTYDLARQQLAEMIARDRNRASIIIWSIANETQVLPDRTEFLSRLAAEARNLDGTRLISAALQNINKQVARNVYTVEDPLHEALDIFSFNQYLGWYDNTVEAVDSITWQLPADKPIVISEFGGGERVGRSAGDTYFSQERNVRLFQAQFRMLAKIKGLAGTIPWVLKDFRSPHRVLHGIQDDFNRKGMISDKGERKKVWPIVREWNVAHTSGQAQPK